MPFASPLTAGLLAFPVLWYEPSRALIRVPVRCANLEVVARAAM